MKTHFFFLSLLCLMAGFPLAAQTTVNGVSYIDKNGMPATVDNVTKITSAADIGNLSTPGELTDGWYLLSGAFTNAGTLTVSGDVHLILEDGCNVTSNGSVGQAGINVSAGNSLTIYGQPFIVGVGSLTATGASVAVGSGGGAGIGGNDSESGGSITICGGTVATSGAGGGAGIGGGNGGDSGSILIYGKNTTVSATGAQKIGAGAGGSNGTIFVAVPYHFNNIGQQYSVIFNSNPASSGVVSAILPVPINGMSALPLWTLPNPVGSSIVFLTTFGANDAIQFKLDDSGYVNNPVTKTVAQLVAGDPSYITFYKTQAGCGLIFNAGTGMFYLDVAGNGSIIDPVNVPYTGQSGAWSWDAASKTLSLNGFSWTASTGTALSISNSASITIDLSGTNTFTGDFIGVVSNGDLTFTGSGQLNAASDTLGLVDIVGSLTVSGGTVNATGGVIGILASTTTGRSPFTYTGGTVVASGDTYALYIYGGSPDITAPAYTYWTNSASPRDPGGSGTDVPPGAPYSYSSGDLFVKFAIKTAPTVALTASAVKTLFDDITLTATVSPAGNGSTPTGTVAFKQGDEELGEAWLNGSGVATFICTSPFSIGSYTYSATYSGDENYYPNSATATVDVPAGIFVSPNSLNFIAAGETKPVTVMCNSNWSLASDAAWATMNSSNGGDYTMFVTAKPNPSATQRTMLFTFRTGTDVKTLRVTQDAADATAIRTAETPSAIVYSQDGNVIVKADAPVQRIAVYDVSGKMLKQLKGGNGIITISGLPKQQVLIVKVTSDGESRNYKLTIDN